MPYLLYASKEVRIFRMNFVILILIVTMSFRSSLWLILQNIGMHK